VSAVRTAPPLSPLLVLPERPPLGTPSRKVMVIRHEKTDADSIVRFRISGEVGVLRGDVPAKEGAGRRIFYDVAPAKLGQRNIEPIEVHDGVVARVRAGQYDTDIVRLVIELEGDREPSLFISKKPFELVLSSPLPGAALATSTTLPTADVVAGVIPVPPKLPPPPDASEVRARLSQGLPSKPGVKDGVSISQQLGLKVHRVVIDAGHGGHDTGAIGPSGIKEKDITLQLAQRVKAKLNAELPDIEVIMTRDDDRTLALQDRTNTANSAAADLFISIHCNASPIKRVRGVETYYLNITHDRYAMRLAARENAELGDGSISDLDFILADLAMKSNVDDSVRLGRSVQGAMMKKLHRHWPDVPDLGLKHALFYVLMGNRMPSILVETSFLSNKTEERRLASPEYQEAIADGVVDGVRAFVAERQAFFANP
jgi:N-acetylmuramoyl-L-alanine amidase